MKFTKKELHNEIWKDIPEFKGYQASNLGRIKSLGRNYFNGVSYFTRQGRIMKINVKNSAGYYMLSIWIDARQKSKMVHRLVAFAFLKRIDGKNYINHKDGNKLNNRVENLEYCSNRENSIHYLNSIGHTENGIYFIKGKWMVRIRLKGTRLTFGYYIDKSRAIDIRDVIIEKVENSDMNQNDIINLAKEYRKLYSDTRANNKNYASKT